MKGRLAIQIVDGASTPAVRLRWAMERAGWAGSRSAFADRLGMHPSALAPSNFKLTDRARHQAAELLGVRPGFLAPLPDLPADLPADLLPMWEAVQRVRALVAQAPGWHPASAVARVAKPTSMSVDEAILGQLRERAQADLSRPVPIALPLGQWCELLDALVDGAVTDRAELDDRRLRLARCLHSQLQGPG